MGAGRHQLHRGAPRRVFVEGLPASEPEVRLQPAASRYVSRVLRLDAGDPLILFDGSGWEFLAEIRNVSRQAVVITIRDKWEARREPAIEIFLGIALLAGQKMDLVVQKAAELGVHAICPIVTDRTVKAMGPRRALEKTKRWQRISQEASRQCGRSDVADVQPLASLDRVLAGAVSFDLRILLSENASEPLSSVSVHSEGPPRRIFLLSGPEGGFSPEEETQAVSTGFSSVNLGPRTLRAETAAIVAVGLIQYLFGDLGRSREPATP